MAARGKPQKARGRAEARNQRLRKVAARLFLKRGYDSVSIDQIVAQAGGSKSTVYSEFGGKCGLFISSIEELCRESNEPPTKLVLDELTLEAALITTGLQILKQATTRRAIELHRLAVGEATHCPEVGEAWYKHGPARRIAYIRAVLDEHTLDEQTNDLRRIYGSTQTLATMLHDAWTGDLVSRLLTGHKFRPTEAQLLRKVEAAVAFVLAPPE
jgi:AcrR family transcriptional regulator